MADTVTTNYKWIMPEDQGSSNTWGAKLNGDLQQIDAQVWINNQAFAPSANYSINYTPTNVNLQSVAQAGATVSLFNGTTTAANKMRWQLGTDTVAETGGNAGSDLIFNAYGDTGALIGTMLEITRQGAVTLGASGSLITFNGTASFANPMSFGSTVTLNDTLNINSSDPLVGQPSGGLFYGVFHNAIYFQPSAYPAGSTTPGSYWGSIIATQYQLPTAVPTLAITGPNIMPTGVPGGSSTITFNCGPIVNNQATGNVTVTGPLIVDETTAIGGFKCLFDQTGIRLQPGSGTTPDVGLINAIGGGNTSSGVIITSSVSGGTTLQVGGQTGDLFFQSIHGTGNAYKAGGGPWTALSDARLKDVVRPYDLGLGAISALDPVVYRYKGNETERVGLIAQDVERYMPGMVSKIAGTINGRPVSDLRTLDTNELIYALINAVKELRDELDKVKARLE